MENREHSHVADALEVFRQNVGIVAAYIPAPTPGALSHIIIEHQGLRLSFHAFVATTRSASFGLELGLWQAELSSRNRADPILLVARRLTEAQRAELRRWNINYLDGAGNAFLNAPGLFVLVGGQRAKKETGGVGASVVFREAGLKCLAYWLSDPLHIRQSVRFVAGWTGVSIGSVSQILRDLERLGYITTFGTRRTTVRLWNDSSALMRRWGPAYAETLRPRLKQGRFRSLRPWKEIDLGLAGGEWGGEGAAELLGLDLKAGRPTLYCKANRPLLARDLGLVPDDAGNVDVCHRFWNGPISSTAPWPIVYADLLASGDARNLSAAKELLDRWEAKWTS